MLLVRIAIALGTCKAVTDKSWTQDSSRSVHTNVSAHPALAGKRFLRLGFKCPLPVSDSSMAAQPLYVPDDGAALAGIAAAVAAAA